LYYQNEIITFVLKFKNAVELIKAFINSDFMYFKKLLVQYLPQNCSFIEPLHLNKSAKHETSTVFFNIFKLKQKIYVVN